MFWPSLIILGIVLAGKCAKAEVKSLDVVVASINKRLNPKFDGDIGNEIDYRSENGWTWINIDKVIMVCDKAPDTYLKNGKLFTDKAECSFHAADMSLYQITCRNKPVAECKKLLAKELTVDLIMEIERRGIHQVYLK
jgi:hypothetical protein